MLMIDHYETPEDGMPTPESCDIERKIDILCAMAEDDKLIHPETVLAMFGRTQALERLTRKRKEDRDWWLGKQKEAMYVD